jgi:opacity protein-like surface antigen
MKATIILLVLLAMAMAAVVAAQPVNPVAGFFVDGHAMEPAWMVLSGATLLALASAVRRYLP